MRPYDPLFTENDILGLWQSNVGLERESLRITNQAKISDLSHPAELGNRDYHPYIQTDFAESQLEFITPPFENSSNLISWLAACHQIVANTMDDHLEYLWPYSTPPMIPSSDKIKIAQLNNVKDIQYREHLSDYYGYDVQLLSGIHYNFQINSTIIEEKISDQANHVEVRNKIYSKLARNYLRYRWILTYLLGASPFVPNEYSTKLYGKPNKSAMRSIRQSRFGYMNHPDIKVRYSSIEDFVDDLEDAVKSCKLSEEKELYADVRFKNAKPSRQMIQNGIKYLELRNFDLNPFAPYGIDEKDIDFIKLFVITMLMIPDIYYQEEIDFGNKLNNAIAESDPLAPHLQDNEAGYIFQHMKRISSIIDQALSTDYSAIVKEKEKQMSKPELTLSGRILNIAKNSKSLVKHGLQLAKEHQKIYLNKNYLLHGFESFEISTQDLIKEAMKIGLTIEIIDKDENLIDLSYGDHHELIRQANMTSKDNLISYFLMENKVATKHILNQVGLSTPSSKTFSDYQTASAYYPSIANKAIVVKPKSTNYGLGITIFSETANEKNYQEALKVAFKEDTQIIVEDFIEGTELRFYVQGDEVKAVCERQAAHVVGDGIHTIEQLMDIVNQHPLRGPQHLAPLTNLEQGDVERLELKKQGLNFQSIPEKDQIIYLRRNSNISTGGISIDRTDTVDPSFKAIAIKASKALGAYFCGVDILIKDPKGTATEGNYGIIEANFNPAMMIHRFVGVWQDRYLAYELIKDLFPELNIK